VADTFKVKKVISVFDASWRPIEHYEQGTLILDCGSNSDVASSYFKHLGGYLYIEANCWHLS